MPGYAYAEFIRRMPDALYPLGYLTKPSMLIATTHERRLAMTPLVVMPDLIRHPGKKERKMKINRTVPIFTITSSNDWLIKRGLIEGDYWSNKKSGLLLRS